MYIPGVDDSEIPDSFRMGVARGADEFRTRAQANVDGGADFLKIIASGAVFGYGGVHTRTAPNRSRTPFLPVLIR